MRSPLRVLVAHDAAGAVRLLEQCAREPPFAGPLGKQNRLRVARALLAYAADLQVSAVRAALRVLVGNNFIIMDEYLKRNLKFDCHFFSCRRQKNDWKFSSLSRGNSVRARCRSIKN